MQTIEIDFEVYKALTNQRATENVTYNDVLRALLRLGEQANGSLAEKTAGDRPDKVSNAIGWTTKGAFFPLGTEFRARYEGVVHTGEVVAGGVKVAGKVAASPSRAARYVTHNSVNGWDFWECRLPGHSRWQPIKLLRPSL